MSESTIQAQIRKAVNLDGRVLVVRNTTGFDRERKIRYGLGNGGADLVGMIRGTGRVVAIEVKTPIGRLSADQVAWLGAVRARGGFACVVRSVTEALAAVDRAVAGAAE